MALMKYAAAKVEDSTIEADDWNGIRRRAASDSSGFRKNARSVDLNKYNPDDYLLSHATIIASVNVDEVPNVKTGQQVESNGKTIKRPYNDYYITPDTSKFVNQNGDAWERELLLETYETFIGAENYCFSGNTQVLMSDGTYKSIEEIEEGEFVTSHTGESREVVECMDREVDEKILEIGFDRYDEKVEVTKEHPFLVIDVDEPEFSHRSSSSEDSKERYRRDQKMKYLRGDDDAKEGYDSELKWKEVSNIKVGDYVVSPSAPETYRVISDSRASLLGHYLAEGCLIKSEGEVEGAIITPGIHEDEVVEDVKSSLSVAFPSARVNVSETPTSTFRISIRGEEVGKWFEKYAGHGASNKSLHEDVFNWDEDSLEMLLASWLNGDGDYHKESGRMRGSSVSEDLCFQMKRICDILGYRSSVTKTEKKGNKHKIDVPSYGEHTIEANHDLWQITVSKDDSHDLAKKALRWNDVTREEGGPKKSREFSFWNGRRVHRVNSLNEKSFEGKVHNIEVEGDHSYTVFPGVSVHNCEHVQIPELSKGKVVDAVARDLDDTVYVDILVATDKKHESLVRDIKGGKVNKLSMGCSISYSICSKCGNLASDETDLCQHVRYMKGNTFTDENGTERIISELCGHKEDPDSVKFIEASWVVDPAFDGAVLQKVLGEEEQREYNESNETDLAQTIEQAHDISLSHRNGTPGASMDSFLKSAHYDGDSSLISDLEEPKEDSKTAQWGDDGDDEEEDDGNDEKTPIEKAVENVKEYVGEEAAKELIDQVGGKSDLGETDWSDAPPPMEEDSNKNLLNAYNSFAGRYASQFQSFDRLTGTFVALHKANKEGWGVVKQASGIDNKDIVSAMYLRDRDYKGQSLPPEIYNCLNKVGGGSNYNNLDSFLNACELALDRKLSSGEKKILVRRAKLLK